MTEAARREPGVIRLVAVLAAWGQLDGWRLCVDLLAVLIAVMLPWSTSGVAIAAALWIVALVPTLDCARLRGR